MVPRGVLRKGLHRLRAIITPHRDDQHHHSGLPPRNTSASSQPDLHGRAPIIRTLLRVVVVVLVLEVVILEDPVLLSLAWWLAATPIKRAVYDDARLPDGVSTSASVTILGTLRQTKKNGVSDAVKPFTILLCATIHSILTSKIFFAFAIAPI